MHPQTLRIYERAELIKPQRSSGNTRLYSDADIERLRLIQQLTQDEGVNLAGVERILELRERARAHASARSSVYSAHAEEMQLDSCTEVESVRREYQAEIVMVRGGGLARRRAGRSTMNRASPLKARGTVRGYSLRSGSRWSCSCGATSSRNTGGPSELPAAEGGAGGVQLTRPATRRLRSSSPIPGDRRRIGDGAGSRCRTAWSASCSTSSRLQDVSPVMDETYTVEFVETTDEVRIEGAFEDGRA